MALTPLTDSVAGKAMLRVYDGAQKGATAFFRNRPLLETLMVLLEQRQGRPLRILFHAGSIGAEVYSFVIYALRTGLANRCPLEIYTTDLNPQFLQFAEEACYPAEVLETFTAEERVWFESLDSGMVRPVEAVRRCVWFLPACSFVDAVPPEGEVFDVVFILNALTYVTPDQQAECLRNVARYNTDLLVACAFHPDTIRRDLLANGYEPVTTRIAEIHNAWTERIRTEALPPPDSPDYSWVIPPYSEIPEHEFRFCSIFQKRAAHPAGSTAS
jgi:hypothetical protein